MWVGMSLVFSLAEMQSHPVQIHQDTSIETSKVMRFVCFTIAMISARRVWHTESESNNFSDTPSSLINCIIKIYRKLSFRFQKTSWLQKKQYMKNLKAHSANELKIVHNLRADSERLRQTPVAKICCRWRTPFDSTRREFIQKVKKSSRINNFLFYCDGIVRNVA